MRAPGLYQVTEDKIRLKADGVAWAGNPSTREAQVASWRSTWKKKKAFFRIAGLRNGAAVEWLVHCVVVKQVLRPDSSPKNACKGQTGRRHQQSHSPLTRKLADIGDYLETQGTVILMHTVGKRWTVRTNIRMCPPPACCCPSHITTLHRTYTNVKNEQRF